MVYIKNESQPLIYKHSSEMKITSNQDSFRKNYLQEFIKEQGRMNSTLTKATIDVNSLVNKTKLEQQQHFNHVLKQLSQQEASNAPLRENINKQEEAYKILLQKFEALDSFNHELVKKYENEGMVNQAIIDQLTIQDQSIQKLTKNIELYDGLHKNLSDQLEDQQKINDDILKTLELQESFHKTILERLEHQEALSQKMTRELDNLKATLFERISYVVEKIEDNYKQVTSFVTQMFSKSGFTQRINIEKEKKQKETTYK